MIFITKNGIRRQQPARLLERGVRSYLWMGWIYWPGIQGGKLSIIHFHELTKRCSLKETVAKSAGLKGNFVLAVCEDEAKRCAIITDPSGMYQCYYSSQSFSTSYLELMRAEGFKFNDLDFNSCFEFLQSGSIFFDRTHFPSIKKLSPESALVLDSTKGFKRVTRDISPDKTGITPVSGWQKELQQALKGQNISIDLTGGTDTRFMAAVLASAKLPFDAAVYGNPESVDVQLARKVAHRLSISITNISNTANYSPEELFEQVDGLADIAKYRGFRAQVAFKTEAGYTLSLNAGGGGIFKDFLWQQDFPHYRRKKPDWKRLLQLRVLSNETADEWLAESHPKLHKNWKDQFLAQMEAYSASNNTQSYDRFFYEVLMRERVGKSNSSESNLITAYSPLLERSLYYHQLKQPRLARFTNWTQRKTVSTVDRKLAALPTNHGKMSLSKSIFALPKEIYRFTRYNLERLNKRRLPKQRAVETDSGLASWSQNQQVLEGFEQLKQHGFIKKTAKLSEIPQSLRGRFITLSLLANELKK